MWVPYLFASISVSVIESLRDKIFITIVGPGEQK